MIAQELIKKLLDMDRNTEVVIFNRHNGEIYPVVASTPCKDMSNGVTTFEIHIEKGGEGFA